MSDDIRNVFISHIHEDDEGIAKIKELLKSKESRSETVRSLQTGQMRQLTRTTSSTRYLRHESDGRACSSCTFRQTPSIVGGWIGKSNTPTARARGLLAYGNGERRSARCRKPSSAMVTPSLDGTERASRMRSMALPMSGGSQMGLPGTTVPSNAMPADKMPCLPGSTHTLWRGTTDSLQIRSMASAPWRHVSPRYARKLR